MEISWHIMESFLDVSEEVVGVQSDQEGVRGGQYDEEGVGGIQSDQEDQFQSLSPFSDFYSSETMG